MARKSNGRGNVRGWLRKLVGRKRTGKTGQKGGERRLAFEACEDRRLLAGIPGYSGGTLTISGHIMSVVGSTTGVFVTADGKTTQVKGATVSSISKIQCLGASGTSDSVTITNIQPSGSLVVNLDSVETLAMTKSRNVSVVSGGSLEFGATNITGSLTLSAQGAVTQTSGASLVAKTASLAASGSIVLANSGNDFGTLSLVASGTSVRDLNAIVLGASTVTGDLTVVAGGAITESGVQTINGDASFTSPTSITLNTQTNDFRDAVSFYGPSATLKNGATPRTLLGASSVGTLTVTATAGDIIAEAPVIVTRTATFTNPGRNINLIGPNAFGSVVVTAGNEVRVMEADAVSLGAVTCNTLYVSAGIDVGGAGITQTGPLTISLFLGLSSGSSDITLEHTSNRIGSYQIANARNVSLRNSMAVAFSEPSAVSGNLSVVAVGSILQSAPLWVGGTTTLSVPSGSILLGDAINDFGTVVVTSALSMLLGSDDDLNLGTVKLNGTGEVLSVYVNGDLTQSGAISVRGGATHLDVDGDIILTNALNDFLSISVEDHYDEYDVSLVDANDVVLGNFSLDGDLYLEAKSNSSARTSISQAAGTHVHVDGLATFVTGASSVVRLDSIGNELWDVAFPSAGSLYLANDGDLNFETAIITANLTVVAIGDVYQDGGIVVGKIATFNVGTYDIDLTDPGAGVNDFGTIVVVAADDVDISDANSVILGNWGTAVAPITGIVFIPVNGQITQAISSAVFFADDLDLHAGTVTLTNSGNDFSAVSTECPGNFAIRDVNGLTLGSDEYFDFAVGGDLSVTTAGNLNQTDDVMVDGTATLNVGKTNDIMLNTGENDLSTVSITAAHDVALTDYDGMNLGPSTVEGELRMWVDGGVTDSGAVVVKGDLGVMAHGDLTLDYATSKYQGLIDLWGYDVTFRNSNATTTVEGIYADGDLDVDVTGLFTNLVSSVPAPEYGQVFVDGDLSITATSEIDIYTVSFSVAGNWYLYAPTLNTGPYLWGYTSPISYTVGSGSDDAVSIGASARVTADTLTLVSASVSIGGYIADDVLTFDTTGTSISASYSAGTLTLSGIDSVANYQKVLRTVKFWTDGGASTRTISIEAADGSRDSNTESITVNIVP